jgi:hypothetical protein
VDDLGDAYQASHEQIQSNAAGGDDYPGQDKGKRIDSGQYSALAGQLQSLDIASEPSNTQYTNLAYPSSSSSSAYQSHGGTTAQYPTALRLPTQQASGSYQMVSIVCEFGIQLCADDVADLTVTTFRQHALY